MNLRYLYIGPAIGMSEKLKTLNSCEGFRQGAKRRRTRHQNIHIWKHEDYRITIITLRVVAKAKHSVGKLVIKLILSIINEGVCIVIKFILC